MRPILVKGHERSITYICYNREGDLIFTSSKGTTPNVCYAETGERVGTYKGHTGAVWALDVNQETTRLLTGSADNSAKIWDVETGKEIQHFQHKTPVRSVNFGFGDSIFFTVSDQVMGHQPVIALYTMEEGGKSEKWKLHRDLPFKAKPTSAKWGNLNQHIFLTAEDGIYVWETETGKLVNKLVDHKKVVNDIQFAKDYSCFITASSDHTAKLWDAKTLKCIKTYETDKPVNAAAISPDMDIVMMGGGQEAAQVTTSHTRVGHFQVRFFHKIFEEEIGSIKGHFGPVNALSFAPDGKGYASGAEDGFIRIHHFDDQFYNAFNDDV
eukprot:TRINITY_DN300_c0_g1_i1.p1 TRINITY_DN300_c0_g1~~TRINITY_DN300_c0_g1_i1.p1  ORF type:complete len:325 (+),score=104.86 TRINITY_DN300_c0_g1_i1:119-1093(+)